MAVKQNRRRALSKSAKGWIEGKTRSTPPAFPEPAAYGQALQRVTAGSRLCSQYNVGMAAEDDATNGRSRKWTPEKVIAGLREFYRRANKEPGQPTPVLERDNPPLIGGARRVFGSLKAAMQAAGLPYPPRPQLNEERILEELRRMHAEGRDLSLAAVKDRHAGSLLGPALHRFGSWRKAIEAAGIDYSEVSRVREWNRDRVVEALRRRHDSGRGMGGGAIQKEDLSLWAACNRYFGSYQEAAETAGVAIPQSAPEWFWPVSRLQQALGDLHQAGVDLSSGRVRRSHPGLFYAARSRLGSWQKALESVGLDYESIRRGQDWSPQTIIDRLRELHKAGKTCGRWRSRKRMLH